jgi:O-antigen/teichoic acid export membrane protein
MSVAGSIVNRIGIVAINMSTGILTARTLHPAGRGELTAMILWPLFLANATALGTPSSLIFHLRQKRQGEDRHGELIASALVLVTLLGAVAALIGAVALPHWLRNYPPEVIHYAQLFLLAAPLWAVQITGQAALEALELFSLSNLVQMLIPVSTLTGLLTVLALGRMSPVTAAGCYAVAIVPTSVTILALLWRRRRALEGGVSVAAWRTLLGYGVRSAPLDLLNTLNLYIDQVLVIGLLSASAMGSYAVVLSLSRALLVFQSAVVMVLFPKAAGKSTETILAMVGQASRAGTLVAGSAALVTALLGPVLLGLLYGPQYLSAVPALRILVAEVVVQGAVVVVSQAFMAVGRPGVVSMLHGTGLALAVPLMLVLIPRYGLAGAALALLCSTLTRFVLIFFAVRIVLKCPLPNLVPGWEDVLGLQRLVMRR